MNDKQLIDDAIGSLFGEPKTKEEKGLNDTASDMFVSMMANARREVMDKACDWWKHDASSLEYRITRAEHYADETTNKEDK